MTSEISGGDYGAFFRAGARKKVLIAAAMTLAILAFAATPALAEEPFGLQSFEVSATEAPPAGHALNALGPADVQAGSHPYALTTRFYLNKPEEFEVGIGEKPYYRPLGASLKDVRVESPPGYVGNPDATPKCGYQEFINKECSNDAAVGEATTVLETKRGNLSNDSIDATITVSDPVYNVEPPGGVPAEFGYIVKGTTPIFADASVRTGSDYGITINVRNIAQTAAVYESTVKIWGVPAAASHNKVRGKCLSEHETLSEAVEEGEQAPHNEEQSERELEEEEYAKGKQHSPPQAPVECPAGVPVQPLLTNPTSCGESRTATLSVDDWAEPGNFTTGERISSLHATLPELSGCEKLDFKPSLSTQPDGSAGSTPTGLNVHVHVPQESTTNPEGLGEADIRDTTVALPAGMQISPSASDGLQACSNAQIGFTGEFKELNPVSEPGVKTPQFTSYLPGSVAAQEAIAAGTAPASEGTLEPGVNFCPDASKIANVRIATPILEHELTGSVYLAAPQNFVGLPENPFSSLIAMYLVAEEPATGVLVKLPGKVALNESTGQITTTFENTPQAPFSDLQLEFYGTARAPLATPALCGTYNTASSFAPWSGEPAVSPPASFQITSGPNGSSCTYPGQALPFSPALASGTTNNNAGAFSALTTTLGREDGQQQIQQVTLHYPPGLSGLLSGVTLCGEAQANAGTCGPESEIGESIVSVGLGSDPFTVVGGKAYITGPYEGAPFGLSIVNPAAAGPFVLQHGAPVVVRAKINVDPHTAALTVTTNTPSEGHAIPSMIEGIPLQIKHVNVNINRPDFIVNPTSCNPTKVTGAVNSSEGSSSLVEDPFQVTNCASLKFNPVLTASTSAKDNFNNLGASLTTKVIEPKTAPGEEANITKVKVELPLALPSRLTTLQKACIAKQFEANPAGCPPDSFIGHAVVHTQLLPVPLEGPAIFVSHGGEAFPSLIMVLQGYGVTIDLVGTTYISHKGITSTTFKTVPDQPFETFELTLPTGKFSALAANTDICKPVKTEVVKKKVAVKRKGKTIKVTKKVSEQVAAPLEMPTEFVAQNGAEFRQTTKITVAGCPKAKPAAKKHKKAKGKRKKK